MDINIFDLPLEILIKICVELEEFEDKKNFARIHPKLWDAFVYENRKKVHSVVNFVGAEPGMEDDWKFVLKWWGPSITEIGSTPESVDMGEFVETVAKFCPNLEKIVIVITKENTKKLQENLPQLQMLNEILFLDWISDRSSYRQTIHANLFKALQCLKNLRSLHFNFDFLDKDGKEQLNKLIQLKELKVYSLQPDAVIEISAVLGRLRVFQIYIADFKTLLLLSEYCGNLEKLIIIYFCSTYKFPYFPKLKNICSGDPYLSCHFDSRYNNQLEVLDVRELCINNENIENICQLQALEELLTSCITQNSILQLVKELPSLKKLTCRCDVDEDFFPELLEILTLRGCESSDHELKLTIISTTETETMLQTQLATMRKSKQFSLEVIIAHF